MNNQECPQKTIPIAVNIGGNNFVRIDSIDSVEEDWDLSINVFCGNRVHRITGIPIVNFLKEIGWL